MSIPQWMWQNTQETLFRDEDKFVYRYLHSQGTINTCIGQFFEQVVGQMIDAKPENPFDGWETYPDLIKWNHHKRDVLFEVKAAHRNPLIALNQMRAYESIIENDFPFSNGRVYYVLCFYNIHHFKQNFERYHDMFCALAEDIQVCYVLPLDVMFLLISKLKTMAATWRNELVRWKLKYDLRLREARKDSFLEVFEQLSGCNFKYFTDKKYIIRKKFIKNLSVIDYKIKKFPLIFVGKRGDYELIKSNKPDYTL